MGEGDRGRRSSPRAASRLALLALAAGALLALFPVGADSASGPQPRRDHASGRWFVHACTAAAPGAAACGAQVVSTAAGTPLSRSTAPATTAYGPDQFHTAYSLPTTAGTPKTIAIVDAYDNPNAASDLAAFSSHYGLPQLNTYTGSGTPGPWFRKVDQSGGTNYPRGDSGWGLEIALDIEVAHEICQNCNILLVEASSNSWSNLGAAENEAVLLGADVVSNSWGGSEWRSETAYDTYFNHPGVVITASTGDSGYGVEYPAASQYVVGVGGTTLRLGAGNSYAGESAWVDGGSGCSGYESKPGWQTDSGCSHRTVADVSADADPNTGAAVYDTYGYRGWLQVGGTSLASPLIAAVFALSGNTTDPSAPYANAGQLHDVTTGSNGNCGGSYLCTAGSGFDGPTGLGTPNGVGAFAGTPLPPPGPDYSLAASPSSRSVAPGDGTSYTITLTPANGYAGTVSLSGVQGLPGGASANLSQCSALSAGSPSCTVPVSTSSSTPAGSSTLTFTGTDGSVSHDATATLVVQAGDFSLSISPSRQTLQTPGSVQYAITITDLGGFAGTVAFSVSGLPGGLNASFSSSSQTSATLTISAPSRIRHHHNYTFTVTGSASGTPAHTVSASLSIR